MHASENMHRSVAIQVFVLWRGWVEGYCLFDIPGERVGGGLVPVGGKASLEFTNLTLQGVDFCLVPPPPPKRSDIDA